MNKLITLFLHTRSQRDYHFFVIKRVTDRINTRYGRNDNNISTLRQSRRCTVTKFVDFVIYSTVFFDISIGRRHISLRLIVVIIRNEILNCIFRKKFLKLGAKLCRKCFVMSQNKCRSVDFFNDICHCKSLARTCNAHKSLLFVASQNALCKFFNRLWLVPCRLKFAD